MSASRWLVAATVVLAIAAVVAVWLTSEATWAVAAATVALVLATLILGVYTGTLSAQTEVLADATKELARIEEKRDVRIRLEKAIAAAESVRDIDVDQYVDMLERGQVHGTFAERVFELAKYADLLSNPDARKALIGWRNWLDEYLYRKDKWGIGENGPRMRREYRALQSMLEGEITAWRDRLVSL